MKTERKDEVMATALKEKYCYRFGLVIVVALFLGSAIAAEGIRIPGEFFIGCNYWGSKAGVHMWRTQDWDPQSIERDIVALRATGVETMRVFPTWSEFQPIAANLYAQGVRKHYIMEGSEKWVRGAGIDPAAMERFRFFCDTAEKNGVKLMVSLITGWMSGRLFIPRALEGKNLLTDPESIMWQGRFVREFVTEMKDHPAIIAWDLGNECNNLGKIETPAQAWNWLNTIANAIRIADPNRPVISGMHGIEANISGIWNLQMQGELLDVLTPHPYPAPYRVDANRGPFNGFRNALHPTGQCLFYEGVACKRAFPQEVGSFGPTMIPEWMAANGCRQQMFAAWMHCLGGYLWWCAFDQTHLDYPPFETIAVERELGMLKADVSRTPKPVANALKEFKNFKDSLPFKVLPPRKTDAVCLISENSQFEFFQTAFGALMLAKQAGFDIDLVAAETRDLPPSKLYIVPSGNDWGTYTHRAWKKVLAKVEAGATAIISHGDRSGYTDWLSVTGLEQMLYRAPRMIDFALDGVKLHAKDTFTSIQTPKDCEVIARDMTGNVVISLKHYGKGKVIAVNFRLEHLAMTDLPNVFEGDFSNELWRIYSFAAKTAGISRVVTRQDPELIITEHPKNDGTILVCALNTHDRPISCKVSVQGEVGRVWNGKFEKGVLSVRENDGCIFEVKK